ncbi:MAG: DNA polymerase I [Epsilonproteobacteria bacterium]|nr:DNA polymerase I [Campylobacterota bacterium]
MKTLTVIDTFGFFFRNYYALPSLKSQKGFPTGLLTGFLNFISSIEKDYKTDYIVFALDSKEESFRKEIDPTYKANRPPAPEDLLKQLPVAIDWIKRMDFKQLEIDRAEADDIIASLVKYLKDKDVKVRIVSHDKDLYQLIDDSRVVIFDPIKKIEIDEEACKKKFGVYPRRIPDFLALIGDSADNIPGVKGIGPKTALKFLEKYESIEDIYDHLDEIENKRIKKLLEEGKEKAFLSKKLVALKDDLFDKLDLEEFHFPKEEPILKIVDDLKEYDIKAILKRIQNQNNSSIPSISKETKNRFKAITLDTLEKLKSVIDKIDENNLIAIDTETNSLDSKDAKIVGFSFCIDEKEAYYVPINHSYLGVESQISMKEAKEALSKLFSRPVIGHNLKYDLVIFEKNFGFEGISIKADTMILAWLMDPESSISLDNLAKWLFNHDMIKFKDVVKKGDNFSNVEIEEATKYAAEDAWMTYKLYQKLQNLLEPTLLEEAKEVEFPFIKTLINMEREGIKLDIDFFEKLLEKSKESLSKLTKEIYELTGSEFNINSTQQLGHVLFDILQLPPIKKTKTGYSTNESVLQKLIDKHPVIKKILEYREIHKLQSTYIEPLLKLAKKSEDSRIHTSFIQTGTATGRLSSKNPNLQNIPVKTELGREIRYGFVAKEGYKLVGIDYSQIELRLLAHFSKDPALLKAFEEGKDIHLETAIKIFGEEEAKEKRNIAKSINFGLIYGMGARKLSQTINVSQKEAKAYIDSYFASFPTVKDFIKKAEEEAKERGYVETLLKRRRYFDFAHANAFQMAGYLREAVNTIFQGSAADLIKLAMNKINQTLDREKGKMLLQIHDELIFEVKEEFCEDYAKEAKEIMENIYKLNVPLKASVAIGDRWGELK